MGSASPKYNASNGKDVNGEYKPIKTNVDGIEVCELMPRLARIADKYTILRSVGINSEKWEHGGGQYWLTDNPRKTGNTPNYPMYGNVVAKLRPTTKDLPTFVAFGDIDNHASWSGRSCWCSVRWAEHRRSTLAVPREVAIIIHAVCSC